MTATETGIDVLDGRHPIRLDGAPIYDTLIAEWVNRDTVITLSRNTGASDLIRQETFVRAPEPDTVTLRAIEAPGPYAELAPKELAHDWDTQPGTVTHWYELSDCDD